MSPDLKVISCVSPALGLQRNENRLQWDGQLSRPALGLNLHEQGSVLIWAESTVWLTVAVSRTWRCRFTDLAIVCHDTGLPLPLLHSVQSTQLIGGSQPPSLPPCVWVMACFSPPVTMKGGSGSLLFGLFFHACPFNRQGNPNWDLYPVWFIWCMEYRFSPSLSFYPCLWRTLIEWSAFVVAKHFYWSKTSAFTRHTICLASTVFTFFLIDFLLKLEDLAMTYLSMTTCHLALFYWLASCRGMRPSIHSCRYSKRCKSFGYLHAVLTLINNFLFGFSVSLYIHWQ